MTAARPSRPASSPSSVPAQPAAGPSVAALLATPPAWATDPTVVAGWAQQEGVVLPVRSGSMTVWDAAGVLADYHQGRGRAESDRAAVGALARAQVCVADVAAFVTVMEATRDAGAVVTLADSVDLLAEWLDDLCAVAAGMAVRDAIGWVLAVAASTTGPYPPEAWAGRTVPPWQKAGIGSEAWLYAAAGLTPTEVAAAIKAQTLHEEHVRAMAALRGVPLPA